jgi:hypothetical protein
MQEFACAEDNSGLPGRRGERGERDGKSCANDTTTATTVSTIVKQEARNPLVSMAFHR